MGGIPKRSSGLFSLYNINMCIFKANFLEKEAFKLKEFKCVCVSVSLYPNYLKKFLTDDDQI